MSSSFRGGGDRISRRTVLGRALAFPLSEAALRVAGAQGLQTHVPPGVSPKPKGPLVYLDYDQEELAAGVQAAGKSVQLIALEGCNHFEVQEGMGNPYGLLGRVVLAQMRLPFT